MLQSIGSQRVRHDQASSLTMLYVIVIKRVNPKSSHHKENIFFISVFFFFGPFEMRDIH